MTLVPSTRRSRARRTPRDRDSRPRGAARLLGAAALLALTVTGLGAGLDAGHADGARGDERGTHARSGDGASEVGRAVRPGRWKEGAERWPRPTAAPAPPAPAPAPAPVSPKTIVDVDGDAANGFEIRHHDGTWEYPPTDSEASAECGELDTRVARAVCRADVGRWYRDLAELQRSLAYAYQR